MDDLEHRTVIFFIALLYSLPEKWRGMLHSRSFGNILDNRKGVNLHRALYTLHKEGMFGQFAHEFHYDVLYGKSNLELILAWATRDMLVRLDGTYMDYHLDEASQHVIQALIMRHKLDPEWIERASTRLAALLEEQEAKTVGVPQRSR